MILTEGGHHYIQLSTEATASWSSFLKEYKYRTTLTSDKFISSNLLWLYTVSAHSKGTDGMFQEFWSNCACFSDQVKPMHINILRLCPIAITVYTFGQHWSNRNLLFIRANFDTASISKNPKNIIVKLLRMSF